MNLTKREVQAECQVLFRAGECVRSANKPLTISIAFACVSAYTQMRQHGHPPFRADEGESSSAQSLRNVYSKTPARVQPLPGQGILISEGHHSWFTIFSSSWEF